MHRVGAVVLAAGGSSRLGQSKQLLAFGGESLLAHTIGAANEAGCSPVIVVAGADANQITKQIGPSSAAVVINSAWRDGIGSSIARGIRALQAHAPQVDSVLLLVCDQPFVRPALLRSLIETRTATAKAIVACAYANTVGVPALFDRACFDELRGLTGDTGAKKIIMRDQTRVATIAFPEGKIDIDTREDYQRLMSRTGQHGPDSATPKGR